MTSPLRMATVGLAWFHWSAAVPGYTLCYERNSIDMGNWDISHMKSLVHFSNCLLFETHSLTAASYPNFDRSCLSLENFQPDPVMVGALKIKIMIKCAYISLFISFFPPPFSLFHFLPFFFSLSFSYSLFFKSYSSNMLNEKHTSKVTAYVSGCTDELKYPMCWGPDAK